MIKSLKNNPILAHQMSHAQWPSPRTAWLLAAALTVIGLAVTINAYVVSPGSTYRPRLNLSSFIWNLELLLMVFGVLITAVVVVAATVRAINSQVYQMIHISQLSERDVVNGYLAGAVFRLRILWMIIGGLTLPWIMAMIHEAVASEITLYCYRLLSLDCHPPEPSEIFLQKAGSVLIGAMIQIVLVIAWHYFAATLGAWMAFSLRHIVEGLIVTLLPLTFIIVIQIAALILVPFFFERSIFLPVAAINIGLGWLAYRQAVKCVRSTIE